MEIKLENCMDGEGYSFPESYVSYRLNFDEAIDEESVSLKISGEEIPCQLTDKLYENESLKSAELSFCTDLPQKSEKVFLLTDNRKKSYESIASESDDNIILKNDFICVTVEKQKDILFTVSGEGVCGTAILEAESAERNVKIIENGPVFAIAEIAVTLRDGGHYRQTLTLYKSCEYVISDEKMQVCKEHKMKIFWNLQKPLYRITQCGETEGRRSNCFTADEYTDELGKIPQRMLPHDQTNGFANTVYAAFFDEKAAVGVFSGDINKWNDESYAIEGYNYTNAINMYCKYSARKCSLYFEYSINSGSRQTAICVYDAKKEKQSVTSAYINDLYFYYSKLPLNEFKDWVLKWDSDKNEYPSFFKKDAVDNNQLYDFGCKDKGVPCPKEMLRIIKENKIYKKPWLIGPVWTRAYGAWAAAFDLTADEMTEEEFSEYKKILSFGAYYCGRESVMPIKTTLAGHPNFLIDTEAIVGICASLFPEHPMAAYWKNYYERCVALTFKFHIRPDVGAWCSLGGRPTENYGTYTFGCLSHMLEASMMIEKRYGDNPMLYKNCEKLSEWILNMVTPPIGGRRTFIYSGAHAGGHMLNPYYPFYQTRLLGYLMMDYNPIIGEGLLSICPEKPIYGHETASYGGKDIWDFNLVGKYEHNNGIAPELVSSKFTGYGFNLRSNVNSAEEMFVFLQQIDEGQNYRWGRAGQGGCGNIHYCADGKRYSGNRKEDIGDDNFGDGDVGCNFCVLDEQSYKAVGKNDLTEPLIDFGFVKYARINAGPYSSDNYKYRSVLMVDNRYIVIFDAVRDIRTEGKFSWYNFVDEPMPNIFQLKPGVKPIEKSAPQYTTDDSPRSRAIENDKDTRGVVYNGYGDFLTLVTHRADVIPKYARNSIKINDDEYVFNTNSTVLCLENDMEFFGKIGFARRINKDFDCCIIDARYLRIGKFQLSVLCDNGSVSVSKRDEKYFGRIASEKSVAIMLESDFSWDEYKVYNNGRIVNAEKNGNDLSFTAVGGSLEITKRLPTPSCVLKLRYIENTNEVSLLFDEAEFADFYEISMRFEDNSEKTVISKSGKVSLFGLECKTIVRVRGVNECGTGEWSNSYPICITKSKPSAVFGLRVIYRKDGFHVMWGKKLGVAFYKLYRYTDDTEAEVIYEGCDSEYVDNVGCVIHHYYVTCVNGFGESEPSVIRDTNKDGLAFFDPLPDENYVRDTIVNHHGYGGFDYKYNENRRILKYPE